MLIKLMLGALQFKKKPFVEMQNLFEQLSSGQHPETLFITCSDSRIIPSLITQAYPGDLFVIRNIGNIIPPFPSLSSEAGAIEYSLNTFNIKDIIICGHTQCGAMKGLLVPDLEKKMPSVAGWLNSSHSSLHQEQLDQLDKEHDPVVKLSSVTKQNIKLQIEHLKTYPLIKEKIERNEITIHGWLYELESGKIFIYDSKIDDFVSLEHALNLAIEIRKNKILITIAMEFLEQFTHPKSAPEYQQLMQLFNKLNENIEPIWGFIKKSAQQKLWAELGGLYPKPLDEAFVSLVESGSNLKLDDLKIFQKNISKSTGYYQYCSQLLHSSLFSKPKTVPRTPKESCMDSNMLSL